MVVVVVATVDIFLILIIDEFNINAIKIHLKFDRFGVGEGPTEKEKITTHAMNIDLFVIFRCDEIMRSTAHF